MSWEDGVHGKTEEVLTGGPGAGGPAGVRPRGSARLAVGRDPVGGHEDRVHVETLRHWVRQAERDSGRRPGLRTEERARMKELEREVRELRRANEILRKASAFFAQAELDRRPR